MFADLIRNRRSIRRFKDRPVAPEKIDLLLEAALRAPSSRGFNPWEFVVVDDAALLQKLARCKPHGARFLARAPLGIVVCADPARSDVWIEDCSIAVTYIQLMATALDLGSCWIQIRQREQENGDPARDAVTRHLGLPRRLEVEAIVAIGDPDESKSGHAHETLLYERVHRNGFGTPYGVDR
ncbi:MAG: nitroreductase family protein [Desulfobacterales bacterium]